MKDKVMILFLIVLTIVLIFVVPETFNSKEIAQQSVENQDANTDQVVNTPPILKLTFENNTEYIPNCIVIQNEWNGVRFDRTNVTNAEIVMSGPNKSTLLKNLYKPEVGEKLSIDFGEIKPDHVTIKSQELIKGSLGAALEEKIIAYEEVDGIYSFVHPLKEETNETVIGRLYTLNAKWGENDCTYAFIIDASTLIQK